MIARSIKWTGELKKHPGARPTDLPETVEIPIVIEAKYTNGYNQGVIKYFLESTYHWKLSRFAVDE